MTNPANSSSRVKGQAGRRLPTRSGRRPHTVAPPSIRTSLGSAGSGDSSSGSSGSILDVAIQAHKQQTKEEVSAVALILKLLPYIFHKTERRYQKEIVRGNVTLSISSCRKTLADRYRFSLRISWWLSPIERSRLFGFGSCPEKENNIPFYLLTNHNVLFLYLKMLV